MARQPSGKRSASRVAALNDVKVTEKVDVASASSSEPVSEVADTSDTSSDLLSDGAGVAATSDGDVVAAGSEDSADAVGSADAVDSADAVVAVGSEDSADDVVAVGSEDVEAADDSEADEDDSEAESDEDEDAEAALAEDEPEERSAEAAELWSDVRIEPVEIALPKGVGFTLRAYRMSNELAVVEVVEEEDDAFAVLNRSPAVEVEEEFDFDEAIVDERPGVHEEVPPPVRGRRGKNKADEELTADDEASVDDSVDDDASVDASVDAEADVDDDSDSDSDSGEEDSGDDESDEELAGDDEATELDAEADDEHDEDEDDEDPEPEPEEVPLFLTSDGKLLLFRSPEGLVEFVKSAEEHDFTQLDSWEDLRTRITTAAVVPSDEDSYELDLVVENLRGGHDAWDTDLLIGAGEAARDLAYALRLEAVRTALSPGSPLDDLDEGLRASASGGMGGFFARRKLKKIGAQQAALGWRTIIGKISAVVDWRD